MKSHVCFFVLVGLTFFACKKEDTNSGSNWEYFSTGGVNLKLSGIVYDSTTNSTVGFGKAICHQGSSYANVSTSYQVGNRVGAVDQNGNFSLTAVVGPAHLVGSKIKLFAVTEEYVGSITLDWKVDDLENLIIPVERIAYIKLHLKDTSNENSVKMHVSDVLAQDPIVDFYSYQPELDTTFLLKCFPNFKTYILTSVRF